MKEQNKYLFAATCPVCQSRLPTGLVKDKFVCPSCDNCLESTKSKIVGLLLLAIIIMSPIIFGFAEKIGKFVFGGSLGMADFWMVLNGLLIAIVLSIYPVLLSRSIKSCETNE